MNRRLAGILGWVALAAGCGPQPAEPGSRLQAIINGVPDTDPAHDAVVAVYRNHQYWGLCSGTLIAPEVVLTAAHCVDLRFRGDYEALFGRSGPEAIHRQVSHLWIHPGWNSSLLVNDLALLRLSRPAPEGVVPIPALPPALALTQADQGMPVEFVGFGQTEVGGIGDRLTAMGQLDHVCSGTDTCGGRGVPIKERAICFDVSAGGTCFGDSGGPNLVRRAGVEYVAGVNSFVTYPYCNDFACSAKVDEFGEWIDAFIAAEAELGEACQDDLECRSGFCADGLCCDYACNSPCEACDLAGRAGACSRVTDDALEPGCRIDEGCAATGTRGAGLAWFVALILMGLSLRCPGAGRPGPRPRR